MSTELEWDDRYNTNIDSIDSHHKKLFDIFASIKAEMKKTCEESEAALPAIFSELVDYTDYHFSLEEKMMKKIGYNKIDEHIKLHETFKQNVISLQNQFEIVGSNDMLENILASLREWLVQHILFVDQDYVNYAKVVKK